MVEGSSSSRSNGERRAIGLLQEAQELLESRLPKESNQTSVTRRQSVLPSRDRGGTLLTSVGFQEHRRLFGFNPSTSSATNASKKRSGEGGRSKSSKKPKVKQRPVWTRTFVCLADKDADKSPTPSEYRALKAANLGEKHLTFYSDCTSLEFDKKTKAGLSKA